MNRVRLLARGDKFQTRVKKPIEYAVLGCTPTGMLVVIVGLFSKSFEISVVGFFLVLIAIPLAVILNKKFGFLE
jgi:hypothetical protein